MRIDNKLLVEFLNKATMNQSINEIALCFLRS